MENSKFFNILGWVAMAASIGMYVSYIPQISDNLAGHKGNPLQPLVAAINCLLWLAYGFFKKPKRDFPIILANLPGIIFGLIAFATAL
ncbi:SemiSWEET family transporter [Capnocytophaga leadbetteri]|uniref:SemiSWEET family transporter n=1 Tax=Capnocytophaga leadbetteri TaxID=327575 RepID=UPI00288AA521|nr:SemiSWEET family transporter [Capnocytophaga leadbetteri]